MEVLAEQLPSLGIAGLLFVMWWHERQERVRSNGVGRAARCQAEQLVGVNDHLLAVIRSNTEALTALREELRAHRATEAEWITRLATQLDEFSG